MADALCNPQGADKASFRTYLSLLRFDTFDALRKRRLYLWESRSWRDNSLQIFMEHSAAIWHITVLAACPGLYRLGIRSVRKI